MTCIELSNMRIACCYRTFGPGTTTELDNISTMVMVDEPSSRRPIHSNLDLAEIIIINIINNVVRIMFGDIVYFTVVQCTITCNSCHRSGD